MTINTTNLHAKLNDVRDVQNPLDTAVTTTLNTNLDALIANWSSETVDVTDALNSVKSARDTLQAAVSTFNSKLQTLAQTLFIEVAYADNQNVAKNITAAVTEVAAQMVAASDTLDANVVSGSAAYGGSNVGDGVALVTVKQPDGTDNQYLYAEDIIYECTTAGVDAVFTATGEVAASSALHPDWPLGSGTSGSTTSVRPGTSGNKLTNGDFANADTINTNIPADWIAPTSTPGTTLKMTDVEVQTLTVAGTPTSGSYNVKFTDSASDVHETDPLAHNTNSATLQTALRLLPGLESITVAESGSSPNYTHTITMTGVPNPSQFTVTDNLDTGSVTPATSTAGSAHVVHADKSVEFDSNGSELTTIQQAVSLTKNTVYHAQVMMKKVGTAASGVITVDLVDGSGGTTLTDDDGNSCSFTANASSMSTSAFDHVTGGFVTPKTLPNKVYFRIRISTAVPNTASIHLAEAVLIEATAAYSGGPYVTIFSGATDWEPDDKATLTIANDYAGTQVTNYWRMLVTPSTRLQPPTGAGSIPES